MVSHNSLSHFPVCYKLKKSILIVIDHLCIISYELYIMSFDQVFIWLLDFSY